MDLKLVSNRKISFLLIFILLIFPKLAIAGFFDSKLKVVTTTLELADFVKHIGRDKVSVYPIARGKYDLHFFEPRPSHVIKLKKADVLFMLGMNADVWVKALIDTSRNSNIRFGRKGYVDCSIGVHPVQVPTRRIQGDQGDVHPFGNPHYWFDLENVKIALNNITEGLIRFLPNDAEFLRKNRDEYVAKVDAEFNRLNVMMKPYKGYKIVTYHRSWIYLANYFGLKVLGNMEPVPGVQPSPSHVSKLIRGMKKERVKVILIEPYYYLSVDFVAENTGAKVVRAANYLGGIPGINTYLENLRYIITQIDNTMKR